MLELKPKQAQAQAALTLAKSYELIQHNSTTYIPADWETEDIDSQPAVGQRIWLPLTRKDKQRLANIKANILFANDAEVSGFDFMLRQYATEHDEEIRSLLVRTPEGLRELTEMGELIEHDGRFLPNYIRPVLNTDPDDKAAVFKVIAEWVGSEEDARSLLHHLATSLAPSFSVVKYVLLIGEGRNGKGLLLKMLVDLFGRENISSVSRQMMSAQSPVCVELNNRLLNVIFDGEMAYVKDSGMEKTLIAGEPGSIRLLYESSTTTVQTNALFVEALNKEPKSRDKSSALQKRLVRFEFPNVYPLDLTFERHMRSPKMIGAFLALLLDHFVKQDEIATKLALSKRAVELQVNQMWVNSPVLQFVAHLAEDDTKYRGDWKGMDLDPLVDAFMAWRVNEGASEYSSADTTNLFKECFHLTWKTVRKGKDTIRKRVIAGNKPETEALLTQLREGETHGTEDPAAVVAD